MFVLLFIFLGISILGDIIEMIQIGSNFRNSDGVRLVGIIWKLLMVAVSIILLVCFAAKC